MPGLVFTQTGNAQWPLGSLDLMCSVKNNFGVGGPVELLNHQRKIWTATLIPSLKLIANASKHQPLEDEVLLGFGTLCLDCRAIWFVSGFVYSVDHANVTPCIVEGLISIVSKYSVAVPWIPMELYTPPKNKESNLKMMVWKMMFLLQGARILSFHLNLPGCTF